MSISQNQLAFSKITQINDLLHQAANSKRPRQARIDPLTEQLATQIIKQKETFITDLAMYPCHKKVWKSITTQIASLDSKIDKAEVQTCIQDIQNEADIIMRQRIQATCDKFNVPYQEFQDFITEFGSDLSDVDIENNPSPIQAAVRRNLPQMIHVLTTLAPGANVDFQNPEGKALLSHAAQNNYLDVVHALIQAGAKIDGVEGDKQAPIHYAIHAGHVEIVTALIEAGANIHIPNKNNITPIECAMRTEASLITQLLKQHGGNFQDADYTQKQTILAHIWGIEEECQRIGPDGTRYTHDLSGLYQNETLSYFTQSLKDFFSSPKVSKILSIEAQEYILAGFVNSYPIASIKNIHSSLKLKRPSIFLGGWHGHAVTMVIAGNQLSVSNRGEARRKYATEVFSLPPRMQTLELLKKLSKDYPDSKAFYHMLKSLHLKKIGKLQHKDQKAENCGIASTKATIHFLFTLFVKDKAEAKNLYKEYTAFLRRDSLEKFHQHPLFEDSPLVEAVVEKAAQKAKSSREKRMIVRRYAGSKRNQDEELTATAKRQKMPEL